MSIKNRLLAAAGAGVLIAGFSMAAAGSASAATLPSCAVSVNCTTSPYNSPNVAGYYGADDTHTHYRYVQTVTVARPQLLFALNQKSPVASVAAVGARICDPNTGYSAETGAIAQSATQFDIFFASGYAADNVDPCVHNGPLVSDPFAAGACGTGPSGGYPFTSNVPGVDTCGQLNLPVNVGDTVALMVFYVPWKASHNYARISFGACDLTTSVCRQQYSNEHSSQEFWEFGIGAFSPTSFTTAPANNLLDTFSDNMVTCYGCLSAVPITSVAPVNPFNIGGLYEAQIENSTSQVVMSPNDSLNMTGPDAFTVSNGSTSA